MPNTVSLRTDGATARCYRLTMTPATEYVAGLTVVVLVLVLCVML
jgi:hypothetical protein